MVVYRVSVCELTIISQINLDTLAQLAGKVITVAAVLNQKGRVLF